MVRCSFMAAMQKNTLQSTIIIKKEERLHDNVPALPPHNHSTLSYVHNPSILSPKTYAITGNKTNSTTYNVGDKKMLIVIQWTYASPSIDLKSLTIAMPKPARL